MKPGEQVKVFVGSEEINRVATSEFLRALINKGDIKKRISLGKPAMPNFS